MPSTVANRLLNGKDWSVGKSAQTAYGAINASPVFIPVRRSSGKPKTTVGYTQDDEVTTTNQGQANIQDSTDYSMELSSSFSKQSVAWLIEAIHGTEVTYTNTATTFAALADGFTVPAATYSVLSVGDAFWISGFVDDTIDGFFIVDSKEAANKIVTTIAPADTEAAGASVTLTSNRTTNGLAPTYNTLQERVVDTTAGDDIDYTTMYDAVIDTQSLDIGETGIVTTTAKFVAEKKVDGLLAISGQTYSSVLTDRSVSSVQDITGWYVDGLSATCTQKSISIEIANGYQGDDAAACSKVYTRGQFAVSGSSSFRARTDAPLDWRSYYENGTRKALGVLIAHPGGGNTFIVMPQCAITEHDQANGSNDISNHEVSFAAEGEATLGYTVAIFRDWV